MRTAAFLSILVLTHLIAAPFSAAEIKTITATGEYRMGDNDTRTDAKRLALLDAKRLALEQAGTYLESVTEVKNLGVARDELSAYTAGIIEITELNTKDVLEAATHIIRVEVTAKIDTDVVTRQIEMLKKSESMTADLMMLRAERDLLKRQVDQNNREISALKSKADLQAVVEERRRALARLEFYDLLAQLDALWPEPKSKSDALARSISPKALGIIEKAIALDPSHPLGYLNKGLILLNQNPDEAAKEFKRVIDLARDYKEFPVGFETSAFLAAVHNLLGNYYIDRFDKRNGNEEDLAKALTSYESAVLHEPGLAKAHMQLGIIDVRIQRSIEATYGGGLPPALLRRDSRSLDDAIHEFREAIKFKDYRTKSGKFIGLSPNEVAVAYLGLAGTLEMKGDRVGALQEYRNLLKLTKDTQENKKNIEYVRSKIRELE